MIKVSDVGPKDRTLRQILLLSLFVALALGLFNVYFIYPSFSALLTENTEDEAIRLAEHLRPVVMSEDGSLKESSWYDDDIWIMMEDFGLEKVKVFTWTGEIVFSTDTADIGKINQKPYFHEVVAKGGTYTKVVQKDTESLEGRIVTVDVVETYVPIMIEGEFVGAFEIYYDITARKQQMDATILYFSILPGAVMIILLGIISLSLYNADINVLDLKKTRDDLKEANGLKDLFTDIMRHDLLNPAGTVRNFTELLLLDETDEKKIDLLEETKGSATKLIEMIESASTLSKVESTSEIERKSQDLNMILKDSLNILKHQAKEKNMIIDYLPDGAYHAQVNPMMEDVFVNLISNAIKYSPDNTGIEIDILDNGNSWRVYVKDSGEGISDENKEKLFSRFKRLHKEGIKGTGLGLAIAKRIMDLHEGKIWMEDNPTGGSIFFVDVPKQ